MNSFIRRCINHVAASRRNALFVGATLVVDGSCLLAQGYSPEEAVQRMRVADGLEVRLVASEPLITQPVCIEFDDRGRLWVIQYLQYPNPAGLHRLKVDRFSRTVYDRTPEPPPRGPEGADRITILDDFDEHGLARRARDFVSGLNLASGLAFGHGGVFILQPPYLLFYPDRDTNDVPDGDPEVLLSGFGIEDAHSVANSLTWGPDGWLYGCQGSTVTAQIRGLEFQQGVWRFHPKTRRFELFCEGGGNSWGLDFDEHGELFYSTNVGPYRMLHGVQGGYYWKSFGKHGALHNPYTFGYFDHVPYEKFTGGHVAVGGIIYQGTSLPERFRGKYIAGDLLGHAVQWHHLARSGSTFRAAFGGQLAEANDTWFACSDVTTGPDDALYVADWHDKRTAHPDPDADWDRSNGRIYKIASEDLPARPAHNLASLPTNGLLDLLRGESDWQVRRARRILAERCDPEAIPRLRELLSESDDDHLALQALWALYGSGGFAEELAVALLGHRSAAVRGWTVRLLGDENQVSRAASQNLRQRAEVEPEAAVRRQLASTAKRLPASDALPIIENLVQRSTDARDPYLPLLLWWALEKHAVDATSEILEAFATPGMWQAPLAGSFILERLIQRWAAEGTKETLRACGQLLASTPAGPDRQKMLVALEAGWHIPPGALATAPELSEQLVAWWTEDCAHAALIRILARLDFAPAIERALTLTRQESAPSELRVSMIRLLGDLNTTTGTRTIAALISPREPEEVQIAALESLPHASEAVIATLLHAYATFSPRVRSKFTDVALTRKSWARALLLDVAAGKMSSKEIRMEQLQNVALFRDQQLDDLIRTIWGKVTAGTPEERLADVRRLNNDLRAAPGDPGPGRVLFEKTCAACHRLFDQGGATVGPDLTHANRKDRDYLLLHILDPSAFIRKEYVNYRVETTDGRILSGMIEEHGPTVTLISAQGERSAIPRAAIKTIEDSAISQMPDNLLQSFSPQEVRDLFSYLQSDAPPPRR